MSHTFDPYAVILLSFAGYPDDFKPIYARISQALAHPNARESVQVQTQHPYFGIGTFSIDVAYCMSHYDYYLYVVRASNTRFYWLIKSYNVIHNFSTLPYPINLNPGPNVYDETRKFLEDFVYMYLEP